MFYIIKTSKYRLSRKYFATLSGILRLAVIVGIVILAFAGSGLAHDDARTLVYQNSLVRLDNPPPLLNDYPEFVQPIIEEARFEAPVLVDDADADLTVRAWRFSYNARGIIEIPNRLKAKETALIMVHPWGIDDGSGWNTPEPAGVADFCTPAKNHLAAKHTREVINPFIKSLRDKLAFVMYSLPGKKDSIRQKVYRSFNSIPSESQRARGWEELAEKLKAFKYRGQSLPSELTVSVSTPVIDYFKLFPGLDAGARYNNTGFWDMPIPVTRDIDVHPLDIVIYDKEGYKPLRDFLKAHGVRHILLTGYATEMCFRSTTAGYENLSKDFNVFLVGDATLATFPANNTPRYATNAHISFAALNHLVTQVSWIKLSENQKQKQASLQIPTISSSPPVGSDSKTCKDAKIYR